MSYPILHENPKGRTNLQNSNSLTNEIFENLGRDQQNDCAQTDKKESFFLDFLDFSSSSDNSPKVVGRNYYGNSGKSNSECNNFLLDTLTREESDLAEYSKINSVPSKMKHFSFDETKKSYLIKNFLNEKGDFWNNGSNSETTQKPNYPINKANPIIVMDPDDLFNLSDKLRTRTSKLIQGLVLEEINCVKKGAKEPSLDSSETTQSVTKLQNFLNEMDSELVAFINSEIRQESLISLMNNTSIDELWSVYNMLRSHIIMAMTSNHICFVVQKIIEMSNKKLRLSIIKDISEGILEVAMNPRGNHTLQCLVSSMTYNDEISYFMSLVFSDNNKFHEMCKVIYINPLG